MTRKQIYRMLLIEGNTYAILTAMLIFTLGSAVLYESFQIVKTQASFVSISIAISMFLLPFDIVRKPPLPAASFIIFDAGNGRIHTFAVGCVLDAVECGPNHFVSSRGKELAFWRVSA